VITPGPGRHHEPAKRRPADASTLYSAVGWSALSHPVREAKYSVADWVRYPEHHGANVLKGLTFANDMLFGTANTNLVVLLDSPQWRVSTLEGMTEFAASLKGLLWSWSEEIAASREDLVQHLAAIEPMIATGDVGSIAEVRLWQRRLQVRQFNLRRVAEEIRSVLGLLFSPALMSAPMEREVLDRITAETGIVRMRAELEEQIEQVSDARVGAALDALAQLRDQEEAAAAQAAQTRLRGRVEIATVMFAATGASGLVQMLEGVHHLSPWLIDPLFAVILILGAWAAFWVHRMHHGQPPAATGPATAPAAPPEAPPGQRPPSEPGP
jgi:hypothetical protein